MVRFLLTFVVCVALVGCVSPTWPSISRVPAPSPRAASPHHLVMAEAMQQGAEIPLVPVPPPPFYKEDRNVRPVGGKEKGSEKGVAPLINTTPNESPILPPEPGTTNPTPTPATGALPGTALPGTPAPTGEGLATLPLEKVLEQAQVRYAAIDSYIARFTRREVVGGKREAEELMLFKFRKEPYSVYFKWLGDNATGREVVYVEGKYDNKIQTLLAAGDVPFMAAGKRMALSPDNILVQSATRHSIKEAGLGATLDRVLRTQAAVAQGDMSRGQLTDLGLQRRQDYGAGTLRMIEHSLPPGFDKLLPRGGKRLIGFCPECQLPVLLQTYDDKGQEVEYYRYDRLQPSVALDEYDFNPDVIWKKPETPKTSTP